MGKNLLMGPFLKFYGNWWKELLTWIIGKFKFGLVSIFGSEINFPWLGRITSQLTSKG